MNKLLICINVVALLFGCTSAGVFDISKTERTDDLYNSMTGVYLNNPLPLEITFDNSIWDVFPDPENASQELLKEFDLNIAEIEEEGGEIALLAVHNSHLIIALLLLEHGIRNLSPLEYFNLIRNVNEKEFSELKDNFLREKTTAYSSGIRKDIVDYEGQMRLKDKKGSIDLTIRIIVFLTNNFGCQFRVVTPTVLNESRKNEIDGLLRKINFPISPIETTNSPNAEKFTVSLIWH